MRLHFVEIKKKNLPPITYRGHCSNIIIMSSVINILFLLWFTTSSREKTLLYVFSPITCSGLKLS